MEYSDVLPHLRSYVEKALETSLTQVQWENFLASFNSDLDNCADQAIGEFLENFEAEG
jgi:hypothetical protein